MRLRRDRCGTGGPSVPGFSVLTLPHPTARPGREGAGMDWAVGVVQTILLPRGGRRPGWPCHWAVLGYAPQGWQYSLVWDSGT